jgi:hypothetical protein
MLPFSSLNLRSRVLAIVRQEQVFLNFYLSNEIKDHQHFAFLLYTIIGCLLYNNDDDRSRGNISREAAELHYKKDGTRRGGGVNDQEEIMNKKFGYCSNRAR